MVDDLEPLVTQCPNCDTRFRVNEQQLQAAHGQVRCGACLTVFEGTSYLLVDGELIEGEGEDVDALLSEIQSAEDSLEADDEEGLDSAAALEDSPMITELQERSEAGDAELEALEAALMAELKGEPTTGKSIEKSTEKSVEVDLPSEDVLQRVAREQQDEPIFSLVDDPDSVELVGKEESIDEAGMEEAPWMAAHKTHAVDTGFADGFYDDEPVRRSWITWAFVVLALFALPAQVLWYQFSTWSKNDTMRPVYAEICSVLGCQLPVMRNVGLITAKNSVLRNHPDVEEALIYDALLVNQATFDQPYPLVELTLTTIQGHLVATRRFTPTEYLAGEAATSQMMPALTPVHISLALKDPGAAPLNFKVRFLPAD
ncbi:MAG: putative Zn finger-like uncharacterized protein [Limisphaerales bacterium]|jgi:predicted Zn finger-like uncharacterized protein